MWGLLVWGSSLSGIQAFPQPVASAVQAVAFAWNAASAAVHIICIMLAGHRSPPEHKVPTVAAVAGTCNGQVLCNGLMAPLPCPRPVVFELRWYLRTPRPSAIAPRRHRPRRARPGMTKR